jgi:hypothetical protein
MKRKAAIPLLAVIAVIATMMTVTAFPETGVPNSNRGSDCGFAPGCHQPDNSLTMTMQASSSSLTPGQTVSVWVNVTRNGAGEEGDEETSPLAVILLAASSSGNGTDPTSAGWTIVSDPAGTGFNENQQVVGTGPTPYHWVLQAPSTPGNYKLVAQGFHDGPSFTTFSLGATFGVSTSNPSNGGTSGGGTTQSSTPIGPGIFALVAAIVIGLAIILGWLSSRRTQ